VNKQQRRDNPSDLAGLRKGNLSVGIRTLRYTWGAEITTEPADAVGRYRRKQSCYHCDMSE